MEEEINEFGQSFIDERDREVNLWESIGSDSEFRNREEQIDQPYRMIYVNQ